MLTIKQTTYKAIIAVCLFFCLGSHVVYGNPSLRSEGSSTQPSFAGHGLLLSTEIFARNMAISYTSKFLKEHYPQYWEKQYRTSGVYDGGMLYGFFIPLEQFKPYYAWWDTGILVMGSGVGCRQILPQKWLNQEWFFGVYGYYDVTGNVANDLSLLILQYINANSQARRLMRQDIAYQLLYPTRVNFGVELGGSDYGQLTINFYKMLLLDVKPGCRVREIGGMSARASLNLYPTLKPFVCIARSWIERKYGILEKGFSWSRYAGVEPFTPEIVNSIAIGAKWAISSKLDLEIKWVVHDTGNYQMPLHFGFQLRESDTTRINSFRDHLKYSVPERYLPYYPAALTFHPILSGIKSLVDGQVNKYKESLRGSDSRKTAR